jgi:hypothetical protein
MPVYTTSDLRVIHVKSWPPLTKGKQMEGPILLLHKQDPTVILFKRSQYRRQITINSDKMNVSYIFCTNTQLLLHITEAYVLDKLTPRITVRLNKINFPS